MQKFSRRLNDFISNFCALFQEVNGMGEVVEQLLCYQERHLDRLERLQRDAALLHFSAFCVKETASVEPDDTSDDRTQHPQ